MKILWTFLDQKDRTADFKYRAAFWIAGLISAVFGCLLWLLLGSWTLKTMDWMICFAGYPILFSWLSVYLYGCRHEFHDGAHA